ncbi:MAG: YitT family protein [Candidatus Faecousia sp.]|nr:YitT family protein [Candidatus Faecousia sp.]
MFGIIMTLLSTTVIDKIMYGSSSQRQLLIISNEPEKVADAICKQTERGATLLHGRGAYTGDDKMVIMCLCSKTEMFPVRNIVKSIDPKAMVLISTVDEAYGLGFSPLND